MKITGVFVPGIHAITFPFCFLEKIGLIALLNCLLFSSSPLMKVKSLSLISDHFNPCTPVFADPYLGVSVIGPNIDANVFSVLIGALEYPCSL